MGAGTWPSPGGPEFRSHSSAQQVDINFHYNNHNKENTFVSRGLVLYFVHPPFTSLFLFTSAAHLESYGI